MKPYRSPRVVSREVSPERLAELLERARAWVRLLSRVVELRAEGLTVTQTAERLGLSVRQAKYLRRIARVSDGRAWRAGDDESKPMGRRGDMR